MFIIYEYATCVLVAMFVAGLAVTAIAIYELLESGQGIMERSVHQFVHRASWQAATVLAPRVSKQ